MFDEADLQSRQKQLDIHQDIRDAKAKLKLIKADILDSQRVFKEQEKEFDRVVNELNDQLHEFISELDLENKRKAAILTDNSILEKKQEELKRDILEQEDRLSLLKKYYTRLTAEYREDLRSLQLEIESKKKELATLH